MLPVLALFPDRRLQGAPHSLAISAVSRRLARSLVCRLVRGLSRALFDELATLLESRGAVSLRRAQWRNQHYYLESPLVASQGAQHSRGPRSRSVVRSPRRKCQRFGQL